jgi:hypothetical protein
VFLPQSERKFQNNVIICRTYILLSKWHIIYMFSFYNIMLYLKYDGVSKSFGLTAWNENCK